MAEDIKRVIEVDATSSSKTIRELREEIEKLKKTLSELTAGTKEYADAQARMSQAQEEVNQAMEISAKDEDAQVKSMQELRAIIDENTGSFGFLVARMQELKAGIDATNANVRQLKKDYQSGKISVDAYTQGLQENLEELQKLRTEQGDVRSSLNASTKALLAAKGSYVEMSQTLGQLRNAYRQLSKEQREGAFGTEMLNNIRRMDKELKAIDASMGNFQRNIGNYASVAKGFTPLNFQVQQIARELPSLTMSLQQFFLAISNNLPMLSDELIRAREANKALKAEGKETIPVFKQVVSSIVSWQTALVVCITLLTAFGKEIGGFIDNLFNIKSPADEASEAIERMDDAIEDIERSANRAATALINQYTAALIAAGRSTEEIARAQKTYNEAMLSMDVDTAQKKLDKYKDMLSGVNDQINALRTESEIAEEDAGLLGNMLFGGPSSDIEEAISELEKKREDLIIKIDNAEAELARARNSRQKSQSDAINAEIKAEQDRQKEMERSAKAAAKAAEEERKRAEAIREANETVRNETAMMQAELNAGTESGDLALAQEKYRQELAAFEAMVDEKQIAEELAMERRKLMTEKYGQEIADIQAKYLKQEKDQILKALDEEMTAEFEADKKRLAETKKSNDDRERLAVEAYKNRMQLANQTAALLQTSAQLVGESTAAGKAAAIAATTINTWACAYEAYRAAFNPGGMWSPALGATYMANAIATGFLSIKNIMAVNTSSGSGSGVSSAMPTVSTPAIVTPPAVVQEVTTVRSLTGASEEERLNQMASSQRVYLVYSDVEQAGKRVEVQQSDTSF